MTKCFIYTGFNKNSTLPDFTWYRASALQDRAGSGLMVGAMSRVFLGLASGLLLVLAAAAGLGLMVRGDDLFVQHFALGLFAALLAALVHVVTFTYFAVTGKAIRQAVALAHLDDSILQRTQTYKKWALRCVVLGFFPVVATVALGAAVWNHREFSHYHLAVALTAIVANVVALAGQYRLICRNQELLATAMERYRNEGPAPSTARAQTP
ncbi:MAG: hypothetical protein ACE5GE_07460 [Phycisphaerae bacterium]